ncbi:MAG: hypothetical protein JW779_03190 [Candidatus Thorarchaeota archaeon]|nr:hypothetical protein [Candidatus Thorarchaeota archaeon]
MGDNPEARRTNNDEGIIVQASLDILRKAAGKVLFEFNEMLVSFDGEEKSIEEEIGIGDTILFEEDISPCPAQIAVTKITEELWYIISTSEIPQGGYPSGRDAMRAAQAEEKRIQLFKDFLQKTAGVKKVEDVRNWQPDMRAEAADVLDIINTASRKWAH